MAVVSWIHGQVDADPIVVEIHHPLVRIVYMRDFMGVSKLFGHIRPELKCHKVVPKRMAKRIGFPIMGTAHAGC